MTDWRIADVWEAIARKTPDRPALVQGDRVVSWGGFDARADALAARLVAAGVSPDAKVAAYLFNGPEYLEVYFAAFKAGLAPINTNYRYGGEELVYLFDNADAEVVVFHAGFTDTLEAIRPRLSKVKLWITVAEAGHPAPAWAEDYETVVARPPAGRPVQAPWGRSGDNLLLLYTGGTTGMPKGVMWRQDDLFNVLGAGGQAARGVEPISSVQEAADRLDPHGPRPPMTLVCCPLMHGTGQFSAFITLNQGGAVATLPSRGFSAIELWNEVERLRVDGVVIVGLAFSTPMLEALEAEPGRWDLSSVLSISSSGSMWSQENKRGLLSHCANATIFDSFGSSEAVGLGASTSTPGAEAATAAFMLGPTCAVFTEDGRRVAPGSAERGLVAVSGFLPIGYYKDPEKSARTFLTFEGIRWSVPGDWAEVNKDGSLKLLGRGSQCINTGGEKVFPEEVEEAARRCAGVRDVLVVGLPDERWGQRVTAVVEAEPGQVFDRAEFDRVCRTHLSGYKVPRTVVMAERIRRSPAGKADYAWAKSFAEAAAVGLQAPAQGA